jgi:hypothetical protein
MRYPSLFVATATKRDELMGADHVLTYHPRGLITVRDHAGRELPRVDINMNLVTWTSWMKTRGYTVTVRDASKEEIEVGVVKK